MRYTQIVDGASNLMASSVEEEQVNSERATRVPIASHDAASGGNGRQRALLVGIDRYEQPHVPDLKGCVNDVNAVRRLLVERFRVSPDHIRTLTDEEATRANILTAFREHLIADAQPGDRIIFHYSGHGSQMRDVHGDEIDGLDETIVPHDSRDPEGTVFDISDDEMYALLQELTERTADVVLILDCCHSGSATRAITTVRRIPPDDRDPPQPMRTRAVVRQEHGPAGFLPAAEGYVLVSGCRAGELSNEHVVTLRSGRTTKFGALTYHLVQHLIEAPAGVTWEDALAAVAPKVSAVYTRQHPQVEGAIRRRVFGEGAREEDPAFRITEVSDADVTINGGAAHGLQPGVRLAFYSEDAYRFSEADPIAHGQIVEVDAVEARAAVDAGATVPTDTRVRVLSPAVPDLKLPIVLADGAEWLRSHLADDPWVRVVASGEAEAPIVLRMRDGERIGIDDPTGDTIADDVPRHSLPRLFAHLKHIARFRALMRVHNPDPASKLTRSVRLRVGLRGSDGEFVQPDRNAGGEAVVGIGEEMLIEVENGHDAPVYVTVLALNREDFSVVPLYPPAGATDNELAPGDTHRIGARGELKVTPPAGETTVLLIATETPSDFRSLWMTRMRTRAGRRNALRQYLDAAMQRGLSFLGDEAAPPEEDWTAHRATIYAVA